MEEEEDEFGPLYFDNLKSFHSSSSEQHPLNLNDQNPSNLDVCLVHSNLDIQTPNETANLKFNDGFLLSGPENDDLVYDGLKKQEEHQEMHKDMVLDVEEVDFDLDLTEDFIYEEMVNLEISEDMYNPDLGEDILGLFDFTFSDNNELEDGETGGGLNVTLDDEGSNENRVGSDDKDAEKKDLGILADNLEIGGDMYNSDLDKTIPGLFVSTFSNNELEDGEIGGRYDEDSDNEDGLNVILNYNDGSNENKGGSDNDDLDDYGGIEEGELGNEVVNGKGKGISEEGSNRIGIQSGNDGGAKFGCPDSSQAMSKGRTVPEITHTYPEGTPLKVHPIRHAGHGHGTRFNYKFPSYKTVFDIHIDNFGNKPWRHPGFDVSDFFNFGLDEDKWKDYYKQMEQLRLQISIQVEAGSGERASFIEDMHPKLCDSSNVIIEVVLLESADERKKQSSSVHKNINGDGILPFPLDGYCQNIPHEERGSQNLSKEKLDRTEQSNDSVQERRGNSDYKPMVFKREDYQHSPAYRSRMPLDSLKQRRMTNEAPYVKQFKYDERKTILSNKSRYGSRSHWQGTNGNYDVQYTENKRMKDFRECEHEPRDSLKDRWMTKDGPHMKRLKYDERKPTLSNKIQYGRKTTGQGSVNNYGVQYTERKTMKGPREYLDEPQGKRKNNKDHSDNCRDRSWRERDSNYRQTLKWPQESKPVGEKQRVYPANVYDCQGGLPKGNSEFRIERKGFDMVHQNYHHTTDGNNYRFSRAGASEPDTNRPQTADPPHYQKQEISSKQNSFEKQINDELAEDSSEQNHKTESDDDELAEDSIEQNPETERDYDDLAEDSTKFLSSLKARESKPIGEKPVYPANVYDLQGGVSYRNTEFRTERKAFEKVHHRTNNGDNYQFSSAGVSEQDPDSQQIADPSDCQEQETSTNQNSLQKQRNDELAEESSGHSHKSERGHVELAEDSSEQNHETERDRDELAEDSSAQNHATERVHDQLSEDSSEQNHKTERDHDDLAEESSSQNHTTERDHDELSEDSGEQNHKTERDHDELAEDSSEKNQKIGSDHDVLAEDATKFLHSPKATQSDKDEMEIDLLAEINEFVKEVDDLVNNHTPAAKLRVGGEMIKP